MSALPALAAHCRSVWRKGNLPMKMLSHAPRRGLPFCIVDTNLPDDQVPADLQAGLSDVIATTLKKDLKVVSVSVRTSCRVSRAGSGEPAAVVNVWSVGVFNDHDNPAYARALYAYLSPALRIPPNRIMMLFHPVVQAQVGSYLAPDLMTHAQPLPKT